MLERSCFYTDKEPPAPRKSGWTFQTYHAKTTVPGYEEMEFKACDMAHAEKQAKSFVRKHGGVVTEITA